MDFKDDYDVLGVDPKASRDDIRKAYRRLAMRYHPNQGLQRPAGGRGDLRVKAHVLVPGNLSERERELFGELASLRRGARSQ